MRAAEVLTRKNPVARIGGNLIRRVSRNDGRLRREPGTLDLRELHTLLGSDVRTILEIGANDGTDTERLLDEFPRASVHCFEPDPRASAAIRARITSSRVRVHEVAIGDHDGSTAFFQSNGAPPGREDEFPEGWHLSGSIRRPKDHIEVHPWCRFDAPITVAMRSLDSWACDAGVDHVDFIWADVQGAEVDLIAGGSRLLCNTRYFYTEYNDTELYEGQLDLKRLHALLPGWEIKKLYVDDVLFENSALRQRGTLR